jgi:chemotaxis-related protein WspB
LLIMCHAGGNRYALPSRHVVEVLPRVHLHRPADAPRWHAGLLIFRGAAIPVIDLTELSQSTPCPNRLSSRIAVLQAELGCAARRFGVLAEQMDLNELKDEQEQSVAATAGQTALGQLHLDQQGAFEMIDPVRLLAGDRLAILFPGAVEHQ